MIAVVAVAALAGALTVSGAQSASAAGEAVSVWETTSDLSQHLTQQASVAFSSGAGSNQAININEGRTFQTMAGFGATFTDSSSSLVYNNLSSSTRSGVMQNLFGSSGSNSIGLSYLRQPSTSTDYDAHPSGSAAVLRTYDDNNDQPDPSLANFSIAADMAYTIPVLQQAVQINPSIKVQLNPWTAPAWMKTNNSLVNGGSLLPQYDAAYANYIVKSIQAYQAQGIPIWSTTVANEPTIVRAYPTMTMSPEQSATIARDYLAPDLAAAGLTTRILAGDDSPFSTNFTSSVIDSDKAVSAELPGISTHGYFGSNPALLTNLHEDYPNKTIYQTELAAGCAVDPIRTVLMSTRNWGATAVTWNVALNPQDGPYYDGNDSDSTCTPLVTVDPTAQTATYTSNYYQEGQASKFIKPGAVRIDSNQLDSANASNGASFNGVDDVAFKNPDGSKALLAYNSTSSSQTFSVNWGNEHFDYTLPAGAITTFTWSGNPTGDPSGWGNSSFGTDTGTAYAGGLQTGTWQITDAASLNQTGSGNAWQSIYSGNADHGDLSVSATVKGNSAGTSAAYPKYGVYACYYNENNFVQAWIDPKNSTFDTYSVEHGVTKAWVDTALPSGFSAAAAHTISTQKVGNAFTFALDGATEPGRTAYVGNDCQMGLVTQDYNVSYTNVAGTDPLRWGGSVSGSAPTGDWAVSGQDSATVTTLASGTSSLFRGYLLGNSTLSATMQGVKAGSGSDPRYGVYAGYQNAQNYVTAFIDPTTAKFTTDAVVGGTDQGATNTSLPSGFDPTKAHVVTSTRTGNSFAFTLDGVSEPGVNAAIGAAQAGLISQGYAVNYRQVSLSTDPGVSFDPSVAYHIFNRNSLSELSLSGGSTTDQNPAIICSAVQAADQLWQIVQQPNGSYKIENVKALNQNPSVVGLLSTQNAGTANGTNASIYHDISAVDQFWTIKAAGDGSNYLELTNNNTGRALSVSNRGTANSTNAIIYDYLGASQGATDQDWTIVPQHDVG